MKAPRPRIDPQGDVNAQSAELLSIFGITGKALGVTIALYCAFFLDTRDNSVVNYGFGHLDERTRAAVTHALGFLAGYAWDDPPFNLEMSDEGNTTICLEWHEGREPTDA